MSVIAAPKPIASAAVEAEAIAAFVAGAKAATPAQRAGVVAKLRRILQSCAVGNNSDLPVYQGGVVSAEGIRRTIEGIEAL
jgi:hypothetical protein